MKKVSILFLSALIGGLTLTTSCNKDDDDDDAPAAGVLTGKWYYSQVGSDSGIFVNYPDNESGCERDYIVIGTDNSYTDVDFDSTDSPCEQFTGTGTYTAANSVITATVDGDTYSGTITALTANELRIKYTDIGATIVFVR